MAELNQLKEQRLEELRQKLAQQQGEETKIQLAEQRIELLLKKILSPEAKARLKNVKLVNQELYWTTVQQILLLYRTGKIHGTVTEGQVRELLKLLSRKHEIKIKRK